MAGHITCLREGLTGQEGRWRTDVTLTVVAAGFAPIKLRVMITDERIPSVSRE